MIWAVIASAAAVCALWLVLPLLRRSVTGGGAGDAAISIYADQAAEVARDRASGLISGGEARAALAEINWRKARALKHMDLGFSVSQRAPVAAIATSALLVAIAGAGYRVTGTPDAIDRPLDQRTAEQLQARAAAGDITARIQLLIERTEAEPDSFEAWWILARSHAAVDDHAASAEAYRRAVLLRGDDLGVLSAYAEAMTLANGNKVPEGAEIIFSQVAREIADPRALYYLALARAQRQDFEGALADWSALAQASAPDAPWMPLIRRDIVNMARFLDRDVGDYLPGATEAEIAAAAGAAPPSHDVEALRGRIAEDAMDYEAWIALARALAADGETEAAAESLAEARAMFRAAPFLLQRIKQTERDLGLDLVASGRGPTEADIASAAGMSATDRDEMIRGMVAGLAARLEDAPDDIEGWAMLIRSYRVLGDGAAADDALARAKVMLGSTDKIEALLAAP